MHTTHTYIYVCVCMCVCACFCVHMCIYAPPGTVHCRKELPVATHA